MSNIYTDYYQMSHLPYATPPIGRGSLGYIQKRQLQLEYLPMHYNNGMFSALNIASKIPISCPPNGIRIYETGNSHNPNTHSVFGVITPADLRY